MLLYLGDFSPPVSAQVGPSQGSISIFLHVYMAQTV